LSKRAERTDVCIIGSGAGGGVVAKELGKRGVRVVVLEAGPRFDPLRDYTSGRRDWETAGTRKQFHVPALEKVTFEKKPTYRPDEAHGVGGSTLIYLAYAPRLLPDDFQIYTIDGVGADWPITYDELVPYYRRVEVELGVSGQAGDPWTPQVAAYPNPPFEFSYANKIIKRGCDKLGIRLWPTPMARLSRPFDGRAMCVQCGQCDHGCMTGAKSSTDVTYIRKAEATGNVVIRPQCIVSRIKVHETEKAGSVIYFDKNDVEHALEADVIVLSAGTIQSPRLLLNSSSKLFPDGLGNRNGLVGKYFMQHLALMSVAVFPDRIDSFRGFFGGATSQDFSQTAPTNSFVRGWCHELHSGIQGPIRMAKFTSAWGSTFKDDMRKRFGHVAGLNLNGEQLPDERNCVTLDPEVKDTYGMPVPRITFEPRKNDRLMLDAMKRNTREIYDAAGASQILDISYRPGGSAHNMGTCRMGNEPKTSVVNSFCQSHDVPNLFIIDGSCFVTGGTANPSLTIHAIALRASQYIVEEGKKGNL